MYIDFYKTTCVTADLYLTAVSMKIGSQDPVQSLSVQDLVTVDVEALC